MQELLFESLNVKEELKRAVKDMGFVEATPVQSKSIAPMLEGRDMVVQAPTGTGKTCAFGIPIMEAMKEEDSFVKALILSPTRELAVQITNELMKLNKYMSSIRILAVYGGQSIDRQIMALRKKPQIIVATPGRLMDHMRRKTIRLDRLEQLILDEADEMLNMGFREDIDEILESVPKERQTVLFSATMSQDILRISNRYLTDPVKIQITKSEITVPSIKQYYLEVSPDDKMDLLARLIDVNDFKLSMVFCNTKRMVDELSHEMTARGYLSEGIHGDMNQAQRDRVMRNFKEGRADILIATDVAARGIDVKGVEAVFNYDIPDDVEYYVHRIGRTGRAKEEGVSYSFATRRDMYRLKEIMNYTKAKIVFVTAPKVSEIADVRTQRALADIRKVMKKAKLDRYAKSIEEFLSEEENQDYTILDLASAFLSREVGAEQLREIEGPGKKRDRDRGGNKKSVRLFINIGKLDKIKKKHIVLLISEKCNVKEKMIGDVAVMDKFSFVNVPSSKAQEILHTLKGLRYNGRKLNVEISNKRK
ncbi:ATP-dependent RNA helicase DeaD [Aequitasia blattaphilus]|uniref:RNA helicase n=1 Tax=Aequitasia blattaphilus TaxID=2949332 RepID=A0ABT1EAL2_9FIRM|nr:DEAD/DEAH box helicase [Aequitasia blattaphilus]MCP1102869.1 DEAD/DEAH box helicase [Aequitasia blattaphilus]MCR8615509.1 DEAD/DEAH box helicase [Aequitasia blattaphilus]